MEGDGKGESKQGKEEKEGKEGEGAAFLYISYETRNQHASPPRQCNTGGPLEQV